MLAPVLVTPPASLPVTLDEAKLHLRVAVPNEDGTMPETDEDGLITALIEAAVSHLDGWTGILGRALVEQTWRQDFDGFSHCMRLPLGPVTEIVSITWRNEEGQVATIASGNYSLRTDSLGAIISWDSGYSFPSPVYEHGGVSVTYKAGYPIIPATEDAPERSTVPAAIKAAILLLVANLYENREATVTTSVNELPFAVNALLTPYRRIGI